MATWPRVEYVRFSSIAALMASGLVYLVAVAALTKKESPGFPALLLPAGLLLGLLFRLACFGLPAYQETDFYRYFFDAALFANGLSPFEISPSEVLDPSSASGSHAALALLNAEHNVSLEKINHPWLTTLYPLGAQAFFLLAYFAAPFSLDAWRAVLFASELVTLWLLWRVLRREGKPAVWLLIYWLNPLLIEEGMLSGHMDLLLFPFLLGSWIMFRNGARFWAGLLLVGASAIKIWPLLLFGLIYWPWRRKPGAWLEAAILLGTLALMLVWPLWGNLGSGSGLWVFSQGWRMNDALFQLIYRASQALSSLLNWGSEGAATAARFFVAVVVGAISLALSVRQKPADAAFGKRALFISASLFLLAPTGFPWYFLWLLPFLAVYPVMPLLWLTVGLALYYMRFFFAKDPFDAFPNVWYDVGLVWLAFLPTLVFLAWQAHSLGWRKLWRSL